MPSNESLPPFPLDAPIADVPTIDCKKLLNGDRSQEEAIFKAATGYGFFYLENHGVDSSSMFDLGDEVFALPFEEKEKYDMRKRGTYFGYKSTGVSVVDEKGSKDQTEFYNMSKNDILSVGGGPPLDHPDVVLKRKQEAADFMVKCHRIVTAILQALGARLGLDRDTLPAMHRLDRPSGCQTRLTHAPPADSDIITLGAHTDYGSVTVLFNKVGGLQAQKPGTRDWKFVVPKEHCAIVNLGDALVKLAGNRLYSAVHRVVGPPGEQSKMDRSSVVFFCRPNSDVLLKSLFDGDEVDEKVLNADDWIMWRVQGIMKIQGEKLKGLEGLDANKGTAHIALRT